MAGMAESPAGPSYAARWAWCELRDELDMVGVVRVAMWRAGYERDRDVRVAG
jgi:hypothetical protein